MSTNYSLLMRLFAFITVINALDCNYEIHICVDVSWSVCEVGCNGASVGVCPDNCRANYDREIEAAMMLWTAFNIQRDVRIPSFNLRIAAYSTTAGTFQVINSENIQSVATAILDIKNSFDTTGVNTEDQFVSYGSTNMHTCFDALQQFTGDAGKTYVFIGLTDGLILSAANPWSEQEEEDLIKAGLTRYGLRTVFVVESGNEVEGINQAAAAFGANNTVKASTWAELEERVLEMTPALCPYCGDNNVDFDIVVGDITLNETCDGGDNCSTECTFLPPPAKLEPAALTVEEEDDNDLMWLLLLLLLIPCCCLIFCLAARKKGAAPDQGMDPDYNCTWDEPAMETHCADPIMAIAPKTEEPHCV